MPAMPTCTRRPTFMAALMGMVLLLGLAWASACRAAYIPNTPWPQELAPPLMAVRAVPGATSQDLLPPGAASPERVRRDIQQLESVAGSAASAQSAGKAGPTKKSKPGLKRNPKETRPSPTAPPTGAIPGATPGSPPGLTSGLTPGAASWLLGLVYLHGAGVDRNPALARHWFEQAWSQSEAWAAAGMAWCAMEGCGTGPDVAAAARWLARLRPQQPARALYLEWLLTARAAPLSDSRLPSLSANHSLLARAVAAGDPQALIEMGMQEVAQNRLGQALLHFQAASGASDVARDNARWVAERLRSERQAGTATTADELLAQAQRAHRGEGQVANYSEALRLYQLAQARGSLAARRMLGLIYSRPGPDGQLDVHWMRQLAFADPASSSPVPGQVSPAHGLHREPTPLADLLPPLWRARITAVGP